MGGVISEIAWLSLCGATPRGFDSAQVLLCGNWNLITREIFITHLGVALLWMPTLGGAPARAPGGFVFEERVGVGVHNSRISESSDVVRFHKQRPS